MPNYIALDWESHQLSGLNAEVTPKSIAVQHVFQLAWPEGLDGETHSEQIGEWLKRSLNERQISTRKVVVSLPRADVVVRQLDLPQVPPEELPDLVRLQAETKSSRSLDELVLDFLTLPGTPDAVLSPVLLATIDRRRIESISNVLRIAGLELDSIGISPVATAELVAHVETGRSLSSDNTTLLVAQHARRLEISFIRHQHLIFTHSTLLDHDNLQDDNFSVMAEIRRSLGAVSRVDSSISLTRAWIIGMEESDAFSRVFAENFDCDIEVLDPLRDAPLALPKNGVSSHTAPYAGPVGMLLAKSRQIVPAIDFLNPRKSVPQFDRRELKRNLAIAGALLIAVFAFGASRWQIGKLNSQILEKQSELTRYDRSIKSGQPTIAAASSVGEWNKRNIDWLNQMRAISSIMPETSQIYLADYECLPASGTQLGRVQASGFARERRQVEMLYQRLVAAGYRVLPHEISRKSDDSEYPFSFFLEIAITDETLADATASAKKPSLNSDRTKTTDTGVSQGK